MQEKKNIVLYEVCFTWAQMFFFFVFFVVVVVFHLLFKDTILIYIFSSTHLKVHFKVAKHFKQLEASPENLD